MRMTIVFIFFLQGAKRGLRGKLERQQRRRKGSKNFFTSSNKKQQNFFILRKNEIIIIKTEWVVNWTNEVKQFFEEKQQKNLYKKETVQPSDSIIPWMWISPGKIKMEIHTSKKKCKYKTTSWKWAGQETQILTFFCGVKKRLVVTFGTATFFSCLVYVIYTYISNHIFFKLVLLPCFLSIALWKARRTNIICIFHHFVPLCPLVTWLFPLPEKITKLTWWESCVRDYWEYIYIK